jgi:hypothetical protein
MLPGLPIELDADEVVAVRHLDRGKRRRVQNRVFLDYIVEKQHIGRCRIDLIRRERAGFVDGIARLMKSQTVVAYGTRLPSILTGFELPSGMRPRCNLVPVPFGP